MRDFVEVNIYNGLDVVHKCKVYKGTALVHLDMVVDKTHCEVVSALTAHVFFNDDEEVPNPPDGFVVTYREGKFVSWKWKETFSFAHPTWVIVQELAKAVKRLCTTAELESCDQLIASYEKELARLDEMKKAMPGYILRDTKDGNWYTVMEEPDLELR